MPDDVGPLAFRVQITVDGVEDTDLFHGNFIRGNQGSEDTFGFAVNPIGFVALADNEDLGVSVLQTGETHETDTQAGTVGMWGINLDTMEGVAPPTTAYASFYINTQFSVRSKAH